MCAWSRQLSIAGINRLILNAIIDRLKCNSRYWTISVIKLGLSKCDLLQIFYVYLSIRFMYIDINIMHAYSYSPFLFFIYLY